MMAGGKFKELRSVFNGASLGIGCRVNQPRNAREADRAGAHRARFQSHIDGGSDQALIAECRGRSAQNLHLRMSRRIVQLNDPVAGARQNFACGGNKHRAHRHLSAFSGEFSFSESQLQKFDILVFHGGNNIGTTAMTEKRGQRAMKTGERIAKVIARSGACSRRNAEKLIAEGRVAVNGEPVTSPALNVDSDSLVSIDGKAIAHAQPARLWRYHKPAGLVTTHRDPEGRPTVFSRLPASMPRTISVGRLDINSEGLLLLTNDGELARRLELPSQGWTRRYRVRLFGSVTQEQLDRLMEGVTVDGIRYQPVKAELERSRGPYAWATVSLQEGKNREIKRLMEHLGLKVARLIRISFGPFHLGHLPEGAVAEIPAKVWREQLGLSKARTGPQG